MAFRSRPGRASEVSPDSELSAGDARWCTPCSPATSDDEGARQLRIVHLDTGSVVTWRRAQMVLLSAQDPPVARIAEVTPAPGIHGWKNALNAFALQFPDRLSR